MPWKEASPVDQRTQFIADFLRDALSITELCVLYGVSRKTGYKWIDRYLRHGPAGLEERSRRPRRVPNQTADEIVQAILDTRRRHPTWAAQNSWRCCTSSIRAGPCPVGRRPATS
jgi:transposase